jgi:Beta-lactamase enzyme family
MTKYLCFIIGFLSVVTLKNPLFAQAQTDKLLLNVLKKNAKTFKRVLDNPDSFRIQIVYTQIDRDKNNVPTFKTYRYRVDHNEYFYPASTVKFPACLLALEKLNTLNIKGLDAQTPMLTDSAYTGQTRELTDATNLDGGLPTVEHYIKKTLLVSDNIAFNRLYEFVGQEEFNENLYRKGYKNLRIVHRLETALSREQNKQSNPIAFAQMEAHAGHFHRHLVHQQPLLTATKNYEPAAPIKLGTGYMSKGQLVKEPFDFTHKNHFALDNQQEILRGVIFPETVAPDRQFKLTDKDYQLLYRYMSMSPLESKNPKYPDADSAGGWDSYCKFFMFGDKKDPMPKNIRIFNKVGDAYGFLIDNAYIVDFDKGVEFFLSAVILTNTDGVFNDNKYEYDSLGFPFMANLGNAIYDLEVKRKRKVKPNLEKFKMSY